VGQQDRVPECGQQHGGTEHESRGGYGHGGQKKQGIGSGPSKGAVTGPQGIEPDGFGVPSVFDQPSQVVIAAYGLVACRQQVAELHFGHATVSLP
jgi:hypothetical protein